jgi:minor histocompatibility antigen H13
MVKVATSFEAPIKLLAPKDFSNAKDMSLLGLGDIVLPGCVPLSCYCQVDNSTLTWNENSVFIALALRFDYAQALKRAKVPFKPSDGYSKPYFYTVFAAYIAGSLPFPLPSPLPLPSLPSPLLPSPPPLSSLTHFLFA